MNMTANANSNCIMTLFSKSLVYKYQKERMVKVTKIVEGSKLKKS